MHSCIICHVAFVLLTVSVSLSVLESLRTYLSLGLAHSSQSTKRGTLFKRYHPKLGLNFLIGRGKLGLHFLHLNCKGKLGLQRKAKSYSEARILVFLTNLTLTDLKYSSKYDFICFIILMALSIENFVLINFFCVQL